LFNIVVGKLLGYARMRLQTVKLRADLLLSLGTSERVCRRSRYLRRRISL